MNDFDRAQNVAARSLYYLIVFKQKRKYIAGMRGSQTPAPACVDIVEGIALYTIIEFMA